MKARKTRVQPDAAMNRAPITGRQGHSHPYFSRDERSL